jgi:lipopolysaccharide export system permease protein
MCLGRFVSDNEILVLRSTGHRYFSIFLPVIVLAFGISVVSFVVNDYLLPLGNLKYNELGRKITLTNPAVQLESNSVKRTKDSTLVIGDVKDSTVSDLILFDFDESGDERIVIAGNTQIIAPKDPAIIMQLEMEKPNVVFLYDQNSDTYDFLKAESAIMNIFENSVDTSSGYLNPREMTFTDLYHEYKNMQNSSFLSQIMLNYYEMELHKKFSLPFGSLFFAFLAMPVALLFGKKNGQTVGLIIGILVCVLYWAMMIFGQTWGQMQGRFAVFVMWFPNAFVGFGGLILYLKLQRK